jgi:hypothetical protein
MVTQAEALPVGPAQSGSVACHFTYFVPFLRRTQSIFQQAREIIKLSRDVLDKNPPPDAFIGRKAGDPLKEDDMNGWINSKDLQPPSE